MPCAIGVVVVVEAAKVQEPMNHVEGELITRRDADSRARLPRHLGGDDQLAGQHGVVGVRRES